MDLGEGETETGEQEKRGRPAKKEDEAVNWGWELKMENRHQADCALLLIHSFLRMDKNSSGFQMSPEVTSQAI